MDINFSIRVVDEDGEGISGASVAVHYDWTHDHGYTDEGGWVEFEKDVMMGDGVSVTVYVDGEEEGKVWAEDGDTFSFTKTYDDDE